jgi:hypothetical protein
MPVNLYLTKSVIKKEVFIEGIGVTSRGAKGGKCLPHYFSCVRKDFWIVSLYSVVTQAQGSLVPSPSIGD